MHILTYDFFHLKSLYGSLWGGMLIVFNVVVFRENFMSKHGDRFSEIAVLPKKAIFLRKTLLYTGHLSAEADTLMNTALDLSLDSSP